MYEMLVGHPPFYANTPQETQYKVPYSIRPRVGEGVVVFKDLRFHRVMKNISSV